MNIYFDEESDIVSISLDEKKEIVDSEEIKSGVVLDFDKDGQVVGIEILGVKGRIPLQKLKMCNFKVA